MDAQDAQDPQALDTRQPPARCYHQLSPSPCLVASRFTRSVAKPRLIILEGLTSMGFWITNGLVSHLCIGNHAMKSQCN